MHSLSVKRARKESGGRRGKEGAAAALFRLKRKRAKEGKKEPLLWRLFRLSSLSPLPRPSASLAWGPRSFIPRWKSGRRRAIRTSPASGAGGAERQTEMELGGRHRESRTSATGYQEQWVGGGAHCHCPNSSRLGYANCVSDTMKFVPCLSLSNEKRLWPSRNRLIFPVEKGQK